MDELIKLVVYYNIELLSTNGGWFKFCGTCEFGWWVCPPALFKTKKEALAAVKNFGFKEGTWRIVEVTVTEKRCCDE